MTAEEPSARRLFEGGKLSGGHLGGLALNELVRLGPKDPCLDCIRIKGDVAEQALSGIVVVDDTIVEHCHVSCRAASLRLQVQVEGPALPQRRRAGVP